MTQFYAKKRYMLFIILLSSLLHTFDALTDSALDYKWSRYGAATQPQAQKKASAVSPHIADRADSHKVMSPLVVAPHISSGSQDNPFALLADKMERKKTEQATQQKDESQAVRAALTPVWEKIFPKGYGAQHEAKGIDLDASGSSNVPDQATVTVVDVTPTDGCPTDPSKIGLNDLNSVIVVDSEKKAFSSVTLSVFDQSEREKMVERAQFICLLDKEERADNAYYDDNASLIESLQKDKTPQAQALIATLQRETAVIGDARNKNALTAEQKSLLKTLRDKFKDENLEKIRIGYKQYLVNAK